MIGTKDETSNDTDVSDSMSDAPVGLYDKDDDEDDNSDPGHLLRKAAFWGREDDILELLFRMDTNSIVRTYTSNAIGGKGALMGVSSPESPERVTRQKGMSTEYWINAPDSAGETAFTLACIEGNDDIVCALLTRGGDFQHEADGQAVPLIRCAVLGHEDIVRTILVMNPEVASYVVDGVADAGPFTGHTALSAAAARGHLGVVQTLLNASSAADPNGGEVRGLPLLAAAANGHTSVVQELISGGADVHICDTLTALDFSIRSQQWPTCVVLLENSAPWTTAPDETSALTIAFVAAEDNFAICLSRMLKLLGPFHCGTNSLGDNLLMSACRHGSTACVRALLRFGMFPDVVDSATGETPLMVAAGIGEHNIVDLLLAHEADVTVPDPCGHTALQKTAAAWQASQEALNVLKAGTTNAAGESVSNDETRNHEAGSPSKRLHAQRNRVISQEDVEVARSTYKPEMKRKSSLKQVDDAWSHMSTGDGGVDTGVHVAKHSTHKVHFQHDGDWGLALCVRNLALTSKLQLSTPNSPGELSGELLDSLCTHHVLEPPL